jgi:hypothetical protein
MELHEVIKDAQAILEEKIATIKSRNRSNGYQIGLGRKVREPWEHLLYAYDRLWQPGIGDKDVMIAFECLAHSGGPLVDWDEIPEIPWDEIHAKYPAPARRAK